MKRILAVFIIVLFMLLILPLCMAQNKAQVVEQAIALTSEITPPQLIEVASPDYTPEARKNKIEGSVTIAIVVDKKGDVIDAKVVKGLGYGLDENALVAVKVWKYRPAEKNGEPVAVKMEVTVDFYLNR